MVCDLYTQLILLVIVQLANYIGIGNPMFQMLDAMLVMYIDLPARMNPGVSYLLR